MPFVVQEFYAAGYRSLRNIRFPVDQLSVFIGANGTGKTNLYRCLQLLQAAAEGRLSQELAAEGGMEAVLWAGRRNARQPVRMRLQVGLAEVAGGRLAYEYEVQTGLVPPTGAAFALEPQIKEETLTCHHGRRPLKLLERRNAALTLLDEAGVRHTPGIDLMASETALGSLRDPGRFPDLHGLRRTLLDWRFYHDLRTDAEAPLRRPCLAVTSPTLASDGGNLAAVFATLAYIRQDRAALDAAIDDAFPGARLIVPPPVRNASFGICFADYPRRVFEAIELSDGTLRYLALAGALLAYRLPSFLALNEPENSLHPDLLEPLARLIVQAAQRTQVWVVTHSERLASALHEIGHAKPRRVIKKDGETWLDGLTLGGEFI